MEKNKRLVTILVMVCMLLLIPFIAMQFTEEVNWTTADFLVMGILLTVTGVVCEIIMRKAKTTRSRIIVCGIVLLAFFFIWAELAVGVFGTPLAGS